ncbi:MAG: FkbM family methyltransferase [Verrucomicrobiota bacterium]
MFSDALFLKVCRSLGEWHEDNYDVDRFGKVGPKEKLKDWLGAKLVRRNHSGLGKAAEKLGSRFPSLQRTWDLLEDAESKELLVDLMAYRLLGHRHVKLPTNTSDYWSTLSRLENAASAGGESIKPGFMEFNLVNMDLSEFGVSMKAYIRPPAIMAQLFLKQYCYEVKGRRIGVEDGDTVIDCGGCWGETAIHFSEQAGSEGKVISFEFVPSNLEIYRKNLGLNPELSKRIQLIENPVWSEEGGELHFQDRGPASMVDTKPFDGSTGSVRIRTIDSVVEESGLQEVSFIKMDIEGAELPALRGAEETIRRHRPKLAISVYHSVEEFYTIPDYIHSLGLDYQFYLGHATIHSEETVLFAIAGDATPDLKHS